MQLRTDPSCAHTNKHFLELWAADGDEGDVGFPGSRLSEQRLPISRWPWQHCTLRIWMLKCMFMYCSTNWNVWACHWFTHYENISHLWDPGSEALVLTGVLQEVDKLQDLQFGFFAACDVLETHTDIVCDYLGFGFTHAKGVCSSPTSTSTCHGSLPHGKKQKSNQKYRWENAGKKGPVEEEGELK